jgi:hypothetical protein
LLSRTLGYREWRRRRRNEMDTRPMALDQPNSCRPTGTTRVTKLD